LNVKKQRAVSGKIPLSILLTLIGMATIGEMNLAPLFYLLVLSTNTLAMDRQRLITLDNIGPITPTTSEAELRKSLKAVDVAQTELSSEGETEKGTTLYPNDPSRKIEIRWQDEQRKTPRHVSTQGNYWKTESGIGIGTSLKELEKQNGKPFTLNGFAWDYEGTVCSWEGGNLEKTLMSPNTRILLRLSPSGKNYQGTKLYSQVNGERCYPSSHKAMQFLNPKVYEVVGF
jgi:hypothetical protein